MTITIKTETTTQLTTF